MKDKRRQSVVPEEVLGLWQLPGELLLFPPLGLMDFGAVAFEGTP